MSKIKNWAMGKVVEFQTREEEGQGLAEYGLILALIAVVCITAVTALGTGVSTQLQTLATAITGAA